MRVCVCVCGGGGSAPNCDNEPPKPCGRGAHETAIAAVCMLLDPTSNKNANVGKTVVAHSHCHCLIVGCLSGGAVAAAAAAAAAGWGARGVARECTPNAVVSAVAGISAVAAAAAGAVRGAWLCCCCFLAGGEGGKKSSSALVEGCGFEAAAPPFFASQTGAEGGSGLKLSTCSTNESNGALAEPSRASTAAMVPRSNPNANSCFVRLAIGVASLVGRAVVLGAVMGRWSSCIVVCEGDSGERE
jgi:hypothetical protein